MYIHVYIYICNICIYICLHVYIYIYVHILLRVPIDAALGHLHGRTRRPKMKVADVSESPVAPTPTASNCWDQLLLRLLRPTSRDVEAWHGVNGACHVHIAPCFLSKYSNSVMHFAAQAPAGPREEGRWYHGRSPLSH